jgi:3-oxoadipate CoA-transferase beta subunit
MVARSVANDIFDGAYVNLGIGQPTEVANYISCDKEVIFHSENGLLGMGPPPLPEDTDYDLINAGKQPVTLMKGGAFFHHADSFAMMRGGHIDICVLGAFQVATNGDLANWSTGAPGAIPAVGGAMDLATGAKQTWIMMDLLTKDGGPKLVRTCTYPLTGLICVKRVYSDHGTFELKKGKIIARDLPPGLNIAMLEKLLDLPICGHN